MLITLVSFKDKLNGRKRYDSFVKIENDTKADFVLFCGNTLYNESYLKDLQGSIENSNTTVLFEVGKVKESSLINLKYCLYTIQKGQIVNLYTNQLFTQSADINNNESLCERFINELETRRRLTVNGKKCLILQCGENNIIRNIQSEHNRAVFRLEQRKDLEERFMKLLQSVDIILNPIHSPMSNYDKIEKRRIFLSDSKRYYFSVCNAVGKVGFDSSRIYYGYYNGKLIDKAEEYCSRDYILLTYQI